MPSPVFHRRQSHFALEGINTMTVDSVKAGLANIAFDDSAGVGVRIEPWEGADGKRRFVGLTFVTRRGEESHDLTSQQAFDLARALNVLGTDGAGRASEHGKDLLVGINSDTA